jgi:hypothetical protein
MANRPEAAAVSPWLVVILLMAVVTAGLVGVALLMIKAARQGSSAHEDDLLREARERVGSLMERAEAVKARYRAATAEAPPPSGATKQLVAKVESELDAIGEVWLGMQQRLERARNADPGAVAEGPISHALALARDPEDRHRHEQAMARATEVDGLVARLAEAPVQAVERLDRARELLGKARATGHREAEAARLEARLAEVERAKPWTDPVGVADQAGQLERDARDLALAVGVRV